MAGFDDPEMKKIFEALNKNIQQLSKSLSQSGSSGQAAKSSQIGALKDLTQTVKKSQKQAGEFNKAVKDVTKYAHDLSKVLKDQVKSAADFAAGLNSAGKSAKNLADSMEDTHRENESATAKIIRSYKKLETGTEAYNQYVKWLGHSTKSLNTSLLRQANVLDERTGKLKSDLKPEDFAKLHDSLVSTQATIKKSLGRFGLSTDDLSKSQEEISSILAAGGPAAEKLKRAMLRTAARLEASGISTGAGAAVQGGKVNQAAAGSVNYQQLAQTISGINVQATTATTAMGRLGSMGSTVTGKFALMATSLTAVGKALAGLKEPFNEIREFNTANIAGSFIDLKATSLQLGMGFKETLEFMTKTKELQVLAGSQENFRKQVDLISGDLKKFGYDATQASAIIANSAGTAKAAGIDLRSGDDFRKFVNDSTASFQKLSSITNISQEQFAQLNEQLLGSTNMQKTMLGMDKNRTREYANQLQAMRLQYTQMGLSAQQANEMLKMQEDQKRAKLSEKMKAVASVGMQASEAGLDAGEVQQLYMKQLAGTASNADKKRLAEMMATIQKSQSQQMAQLTEAGDTTGALILQERQGNIDAISDLATKAKDASLGIAAAEKANAQVTDAQLAQVSAMAKGSEAVAIFSDIVNKASTVLNDSFVKGAGGLLGGAGGMIADVASTAAGQMLGNRLGGGTGAGAPGGGAPGGGAPGGAGGGGGGRGRLFGRLLGAGSNLLSSGGGRALAATARNLPLIGSALTVGMAGMDTYEGFKAADKDLAEGKITQQQASAAKGKAAGTGVGTAGGVLAGAAAGAAIGSVVPIVGTLIGGAIGGMLGGWLGGKGGAVVGEALGNVAAPSATATPVTPAAKTVGTSKDTETTDIMSVSDKSAVEQLQIIAQNMANTVNLLQKLNENGVKIQTSGMSIGGAVLPTVNTALTSTKR